MMSRPPIAKLGLVFNAAVASECGHLHVEMKTPIILSLNCCRDTQLDIKKWEVKQAENLRKVKLTADEWVDHPDRYLLELAGRPTYSSSNQPQQ
jgi:hypothetical protein